MQLWNLMSVDTVDALLRVCILPENNSRHTTATEWKMQNMKISVWQEQTTATVDDVIPHSGSSTALRCISIRFAIKNSNFIF